MGKTTASTPVLTSITSYTEKIYQYTDCTGNQTDQYDFPNQYPVILSGNQSVPCSNLYRNNVMTIPVHIKYIPEIVDRCNELAIELLLNFGSALT